jgi:sulfatase maturation enzyme AslB (radical SAM superfamily)
MKLYIDPSKIPSPAQFNEWIASLENMKYAFEQYKVSLSNEERQGKRKLGARRIGYAQISEQGSNQHLQIMPRNLNNDHFTQIMQYIVNLRRMRAIQQAYFEMVDDTMMAAGIDAMTFSKMVHDAIRIANKVDPSYDSILKELDEYHKRAQVEDTEEDTEVEIP